MGERVDHLVIGGGAYGTYVATALAEEFPNHDVVLVDRENELSKRASVNNHGRLHWGYQYPLHPDTALQTRKNAERFASDFSQAVDTDVLSFYGIHADSRITAEAYERFCQNTNLPYFRSDKDAVGLFGSEVVSSFLTSELTFSSLALRNIMRLRAKAAGVDIRTNCAIDRVRSVGEEVEAITEDETILRASSVFNCTYSAINELHSRSGLPLIPSMHERYSLFQVTLPEAAKNVSATVIYGPYASIVSNNQTGTHILAHVTHSNCAQSINSGVIKTKTSQEEIAERYAKTVRDSRGYLPILEDGVHEGEIIEVKSVFGVTPADGERRVQTFPDYGGILNYNVIFGGKMNSFYDAAQFAIGSVRAKMPRFAVEAN